MKNKTLIAAGFALSLILAGGVSFYASSNPDGLEKVAEDIGFSETAKENTNADGLLADYGVKGVDNARLSTGAAGIIGVLATAGISTGLFYLVRRKPEAKKLIHFRRIRFTHMATTMGTMSESVSTCTVILLCTHFLHM